MDICFLDAEFVDRHRPTLIQGVVMVMAIADIMVAKGIIHNEVYANIQAAKTRQEKMRELYNVLTTVEVKSAFYTILQEKETFLVFELRKLRFYIATKISTITIDQIILILQDIKIIKYQILLC